jgi:NAD(P)-dependent dehydrogenase (short-subunit alcohol dehydrogenase family)
MLADVSKDDQVKDLIDRTVDAYGSLDILVSNVGIRRRRQGRVARIGQGDRS